MKKHLLGGMALLGIVGCSSSPSSSGSIGGAGPGPALSSPGSGTAPEPPLSSPGSGSAGVGGSGSGIGGGGESAGAASGGDTAGAGSASSPGVSTGVGVEAPTTQGSAGVLTAGLWDDNLNYDFFGNYLASHTAIAGDPGFVMSDYQTAHQAFAQPASHTVVDAALVLDTTGSMGDELSYLTAEFANISNAIQAALPNAAQRWALVVYRDTPDTDPGDAYVTKTFDFTANMQDFAATMGQQTANNGGDYPESPELGLEQLPQLAWRTGPSVARVAFWVGDAPHHDQRGAAMKQAILDALAANIRLYPVSASGTNDLLELTMRSAAEITGGRYLFLTDDSGVGDPHKVPEIPCFFVTKLAKALVRAVAIELSGSYSGPDPADVIRTVGAPSSDGKCTTSDGQTVQIF